ncbi:toll/interleukin-1 receptor domain-containing protein [Accumulibacter sp.]|uniref:toll/interleukin-1 receptor domain-containing protein n=1 Tax=Accumulibacter sp. TaxID=2053492 RepID=UPI002610FE8F|nr:toll/interleukin-1 receptor domain-containing protein [Accumulibacter sp.]
MARLYVSYRHNDLLLARQFVSELRGRNHHVTLDQDFLVLGEEWRRALHEAFVAADGLVVLLTGNSVDAESKHVSSQYIAADIGAARAAGKLVMPILLRGTPLPNLVSDIHVEWMEDAGQAELWRMVDAIERGLERRAEQKRQMADYLVLPGYEHLIPALRHFFEDTPYDRAVFVMMKFPDLQMPDVHRQLLNDIWRVISDTLGQRGLKARRADSKAYHDQLWENVCVHMFGSKYGMAVLEDHVASELNPNVTLEYGFMKALNRTVGLFRSEDFRHDRADLTGKLSCSFSIDAGGRLNEPSLKNAIHDWLSGIPL